MADMIPQGSMDLGDGTGYEKADANLRAVTLTMTIILSTTAVVVVALLGVFGYLKARGDALDAKIPDIYAQQIAPPKPRLLPSPFGARKAPVTMSGIDPQKTSLDVYDTTTDDQLPWDKMRQENGIDDAQANGYTYNAKTGVATIPIAEAIAQMSDSGKDEYSGEAPGKTKSNLAAHFGGIYTNSSSWESHEQKLSADASGGLKTEKK